MIVWVRAISLCLKHSQQVASKQFIVIWVQLMSIDLDYLFKHKDAYISFYGKLFTTILGVSSNPTLPWSLVSISCLKIVNNTIQHRNMYMYITYIMWLVIQFSMGPPWSSGYKVVKCCRL